MKRDEPVPVMMATGSGQHAPRPAWWHLLREDVACVLERDPAARSRFEVWTIYPGLHAVALHRIAHALWTKGWRYFPRWLSFMARGLTNVDIHPGARIGRRFFIDHGAGVVIGETAELGNDVTLYHGVTLGGTTWSPGKRHPTLGDGVVVGAGAKILGPITVGHRVRVAANSVVIDDVPDAATVVGIPGRVVIRQNTTTSASAIAVDLNHHLIPDPVGKAIGCLLERIHALENEIAWVRRQSIPPLHRDDDDDDSACHACDDTCSQPVFSPRPGASA